jgi:CheY-like chemotaxis protein
MKMEKSTERGNGDPIDRTAMIEQSVLTCPGCGFAKTIAMPTDACLIAYVCEACGAVLRPKAGDCCVFCSFGSVPCPPVQAARSARRQLLIADDDAALRHWLTEQLELDGEFAVTAAATGEAALEIAKPRHFDAILLDVGLPDMDGRDVCRILRRSGVRAAIVILTAADSDADAILGLDSGASDYITKPFRMDILRARLRAQLRRSS